MALHPRPLHLRSLRRQRRQLTVLPRPLGWVED